VQPLANELQQQAKGVSVGSNRVRTDLALSHQTLRKETLQQGREADLLVHE
jgi:hypothetical protein